MIDFAAVPFSHPAKVFFVLFFGAFFFGSLIFAWKTWRTNPWPAAGLLFLFLVAQHLYVTYVPATFFPELAQQYPLEGNGDLYGPLPVHAPARK